MADHATDPPVRIPSVAVLVGTSAVLVGYNVALNLVPFPVLAYVPANLALAAVGLWFGRRCGLLWAEMGLARGQGRGALIGVGVLMLVGVVLIVASTLPWTGPLLMDQRAAGLSGLGLVYAAAVRIPLGTAVPEEVLFRGVLFGLMRRRSRWWPAAIWSSAVFGLWHIGPTIALARINNIDASAAVVTGIVATSIGITFVAGIIFCLLRRWGGGLLAPILAHVATNSLALLAAVAAQTS